jgi:hypothetical protein
MNGLMIGFSLMAISLLAASPDTDVAVAVAIGLAHADQMRIEVPAMVDVVAAESTAEVNAVTPEPNKTEWVRTCDQDGCRLVPRIPVSGLSATPPIASQNSATASSAKREPAACNGDACSLRSRWQLFGRRR